MFRNYLKIAFRNLLRKKMFSSLNILGLAVGMASAALILLWIQNEVSYDRFHRNGDYLYESWNRAVFDQNLQCWNSTPKILGPTLKKDYPEIADMCRTNTQWFVVTVGEKQVSMKGLFADPSFLKMFSFPLLRGQASDALNNVYSIVITEKTAKKLFGREEAMNKIIRIDRNNFTVTGILKDLPENTRFDFEYLLPWAYMTEAGEDDVYWGNNSVSTFVQLKPGTSATALDSKIKDITIRHSGGEEKTEVFLHPLSKWHLYSSFDNGKIDGGQIETVRLFGLIAFFILLIACINFMNLSTAQSAKRAKEVGIRKVSGAGQGSLIGQFIGESVVISSLAGIIAFALVQVSLPAFDSLVGKQLAIPYTSIHFWITAALFILFTGIVAGSYPAFFLSSYKPVSVLKGSFKRAHAVINPRKVLVVLQFTFAIILICCTCIIVQQIRYARDRQTGYDRSRLMYHFLTGSLAKNYPSLRTELLASGMAVSVTKTSSPITEGWSDSWGFQWEGKAVDDKTDFDNYCADEDFVKTAGLKLVDGRDLNLASYPTDSTGMLINESAVKAMGFKRPLGQVVIVDSTAFHVVGVIRDFIIRSPYEPMRPMVIRGSRGFFNVVNLKLQAGGNMVKNMQAIEKLFKKYNPDYPFEYHFADQEYARKFEDTRRTAELSALSAGLTIFISCLGLFGLAAYTAETRIKEIGIRKVLGASVTGITAMLSKEFILLVLLSILLATPVSWFFMDNWLQDFPYHIRLQWWVFLLAGFVSILISLATVSFQAIKAALANPVKNLRTE
jgi:putative ABC transport system permease protein